ncbi:hypothetical protein P3X46_031180 [Hevea brasiliensis]|uniref:NPH3 domain-containing protein n=1 Tax=Hevea brasiliensis TaxID=3981 RepID=A0ABQ9KKS8_HEVBR|nr:hypothetical protein P3X46_031180 [Hevea brasiliensis]
MTSKVSCLFNVYEAKGATNPASSSLPTCNIEFRILYRYQLKLPPEEGAAIVIEDLVTPEQRSSIRVPIVFPLSMWRELYLPDVLKTLNLDTHVLNFLKPKIADAAISLAQRNGNKGFAMIIELGIFKVECLGKEEVDKIASELINMEPRSKLN